jgi:phosphate starvation-inducible PhoH-like protein/PhoH-like ATPase
MARKLKRDRVPHLYVIGGEKLPINSHHLVNIKPKTANQSLAFQSYADGYHLVMAGSAGVGKSFLAMYLALKDVLDQSTPYEKVVIVRSTVPTRNQGFLPGSAAEKQAIYELPYKAIAKELINHPSIGDVYEKLKSQKSLEFISTSFVRGITIDNAIIVVDEFSNLNFHENDSLITRVGNNCKIIFCGDTKQSDLHGDRLEHVKFLEILEEMKMFKIIRFGVGDIVRSGIVKSYLITKEKLGY